MCILRKLPVPKQMFSFNFRNPSSFHEYLQTVIPGLHAFLVFSLSSITSVWDLNSFRLFPETFLFNNGIKHIKFNAIPKTVMKKKIQEMMERKGIPSNSSTVQAILERANDESFFSQQVIIVLFRRLAISDYHPGYLFRRQEEFRLEFSRQV